VEVLHELSFAVRPGQMGGLGRFIRGGKRQRLAISWRGSTTSLASHSINGIDIRDATLASLQDVSGLLDPGCHLFHDTIRANLGVRSPDATEAEMHEALVAPRSQT